MELIISVEIYIIEIIHIIKSCILAYFVKEAGIVMKIRKWDIVMADLSGAAYSEQDKKRPVLIIQNDIGNYHSPTTIVVPLSSKIKNVKMPTHTIITPEDMTGLHTETMVLCEQVRTIDKKRIIFKIGRLSNSAAIQRVTEANMFNFL